MKPFNTILEDNKGKFPLEEMPKNHEARFVQKLNKKPKKINPKRYLSIAASLVFIISIGFLTRQILPQHSSSTNDLAESFKPETLTIAETEMGEKIDLKKEELLAENSSNPIVNQTLSELKKLEQEYQKLEQDLIVSGNEKVIDAMHKNLELRVKILKQSQQHLKK